MATFTVMTKILVTVTCLGSLGDETTAAVITLVVKMNQLAELFKASARRLFYVCDPKSFKSFQHSCIGSFKLAMFTVM